MQEEKSVLANFFSYVLPGLAGTILLSAYIFTDGFVVGQKLGSVALGALGIATPIINLAYAFGFLFGMGGGSLFSIALGENKELLAKKVFSTGIFFAVILSVAIGVLANVFIYQLAEFLGADELNIEYVVSYARCLFCFLPMYFLNGLYQSFMRNEGYPNVSVVCGIVSNLLNVFLDFLFVFGMDLGMVGAAIASCISVSLSVIVNIIISYALKTRICFNAKNIDCFLIAKIIKIGFSSFIGELSNGIVTFIYIYNAIKLYGSDGSAIFCVVLNWGLVFVCIMTGISQSAQPLISHGYGAQKFDVVAKLRRYTLNTSLVTGFIFLCLCMGITSYLVDVFGTDNENVRIQSVFALRVYAPTFFINGICLAIIGYFQAIGKASDSAGLSLCRGVFLPVIFSVAGTLLFGKWGLWISMPLAEAVTAAASIIIVQKRNKITMLR